MISISNGKSHIPNGNYNQGWTPDVIAVTFLVIHLFRHPQFVYTIWLSLIPNVQYCDHLAYLDNYTNVFNFTFSKHKKLYI